MHNMHSMHSIRISVSVAETSTKSCEKKSPNFFFHKGMISIQCIHIRTMNIFKNLVRTDTGEPSMTKIELLLSSSTCFRVKIRRRCRPGLALLLVWQYIFGAGQLWCWQPTGMQLMRRCHCLTTFSPRPVKQLRFSIQTVA